jgi:hypothetical protein
VIGLYALLALLAPALTLQLLRLGALTVDYCVGAYSLPLLL